MDIHLKQMENTETLRWQMAIFCCIKSGIISLYFEYEKWILKTRNLLVLKLKSKVTFRRIQWTCTLTYHFNNTYTYFVKIKLVHYLSFWVGYCFRGKTGTDVFLHSLELCINLVIPSVHALSQWVGSPKQE